MQIDLFKIYEVTTIDGKTEFSRLIDIIEKYNNLYHFGSFLHSGTYYKNFHDIKYGIEKNGFHIHNGYRFIGILYNKTKYGFPCFEKFYTAKGVIRDEYGRIVDPTLAVELYNKYKKTQKKRSGYYSYLNRDRGGKLKVYGCRKRNAFKYTKQYSENYMDFRNIVDEEVEPYDDPKLIPKIRKTSIIDSYSWTEGWFDDCERSVQKSWKYQSKRKNQWKNSY